MRTWVYRYTGQDRIIAFGPPKLQLHMSPRNTDFRLTAQRIRRRWPERPFRQPEKLLKDAAPRLLLTSPVAGYAQRGENGPLGTPLPEAKFAMFSSTRILHAHNPTGQ
jgi:hypothetical protein